MDLHLNGAVAIVTGASKGIGLAITRALVEEAILRGCGLGIGYLLVGDPARWLLAGPAGWACLLGGVALACAGVLWIEALARQVATEV